MLEQCGHWVQKCRDAERSLRSGTTWASEEEACAASPMPAGAADEECSMRRLLFATTRLCYGAALEAALTKEASIVAPPGAKKLDVFSISRLYHDAFLIAVWTSAHALYVSSLQDGVEEPPAPTIFTAANAYSSFDLSDVFARRTCPRKCPKEVMALLQVLCRSTNPGSRG